MLDNIKKILQITILGGIALYVLVLVLDGLLYMFGV